jgi:hypothetical protein
VPARTGVGSSAERPWLPKPRPPSVGSTGHRIVVKLEVVKLEVMKLEVMKLEVMELE